MKKILLTIFILFSIITTPYHANAFVRYEEKNPLVRTELHMTGYIDYAPFGWVDNPNAIVYGTFHTVFQPMIDGFIKEANITNENKLDFIKDTLENNKIEVYEDSHSIYSYNDTIPVIISNNTNQNINVNIAHGSYILTTNFEIKANTDKYLIPVHIPKKVLDTLKKDTLYGLKVNIISPIKTSYSDKIKFKIVKQDVIISNVITSKGSRVAFSQMDIFSYNLA